MGFIDNPYSNAVMHANNIVDFDARAIECVWSWPGSS